MLQMKHVCAKCSQYNYATMIDFTNLCSAMFTQNYQSRETWVAG